MCKQKPDNKKPRASINTIKSRKPKTGTKQIRETWLANYFSTAYFLNS